MEELPTDKTGERPTLVDVNERLLSAMIPDLANEHPDRVRAAAEVITAANKGIEGPMSDEASREASSKASALLYPEGRPGDDKGERPPLVDAVEGLYTLVEPNIADTDPDRVRAAAEAAVEITKGHGFPLPPDVAANLAATVGPIMHPERTTE